MHLVRSFLPLTSLALAAWALPSNAQASDYTVNSTADAHDYAPGDGICRTSPRLTTCTLRAAIEEANAHAGTDVIHLGAGHYTLAHGELEVTSSITIQGTGHPIIDAAGGSRVLTLDSASATLRLHDLTVTGGNEFYAGGGILVLHGNLYLLRSVVEDCSTVMQGSGIASWGFVRIDRSSIRHDINIGLQGGGGVTATGGGIYNAGTMEIQSSAIIENEAPRGAGIASAGFLSVADSTISGNVSLSYGAGILVVAGLATIERSTITQNEVGYSDNEWTSGGAGIASVGDVELFSTIVAENLHSGFPSGVLHAPDCLAITVPDAQGHFESLDHNLIGNIQGSGIVLHSYDLAGHEGAELDPELGPLAPWTSGGTELHVPLAGSPVIHAGPRCQLPSIPGTPIPSCYEVDQRGYSRADGTSPSIDIGAYETDGYALRYLGPVIWF